MVLMIIFFLICVTLPRPLYSRLVPSRPFEWEPVESKRDAKFWVCLLNKRSREIFVSSAEQDLVILAFSLCLLHRGHNLDPDDSEVLFHLALNHALMRQVRINLKIIDWNSCFEQWGGKQRSMKNFFISNLRKSIVVWNLFSRKNHRQKNRSSHSTIALWTVLPHQCSVTMLFPAL